MIKIEITDPHLMPQAALIELAAYLMKVAGAELRKRPTPVVEVPVTETVAVEDVGTTPNTQLSTPIPCDLDTGASPPPEIDAPLPPSLDNTELDVAGVPWDIRIHTRTRSKTFDGQWKIQRGLSQGYVDSILKLLKGKTVPVMITPPEDPIADEIDYPALMRKVTQAVGAGKLTHVQVANILKEIGAPPLPSLGARPDLIPQVAAIIDNFI